MLSDPIIEELHAIREAHAAEYNYDLKAIVEALQREERLSGRKFLSIGDLQHLPEEQQTNTQPLQP